MVHMLGQAVGAVTDATHGMTLAAVSLPYYRTILPCGLPKFVRFAKEELSLELLGLAKSPIKGREMGNVEYLSWWANRERK